MAVLVGTALLLEYRSKEMLFEYFTWRHQVAFAAGVGHWTVACWEESTDCTYLGRLYLLHHATAALMFSFCLSSRHLSMVGVCGLLFELPVALQNIRQGLYIRQLIAAISTSHLEGLWSLILGATIVARGGPLVLYCVSWSLWPSLWSAIPEPEIWIWQAGVTIFGMFSCGWFAQLLIYRLNDLRAHQAYATLLLREHSAVSRAQTADTTSREDTPGKCSDESASVHTNCRVTPSADEEWALAAS